MEKCSNSECNNDASIYTPIPLCSACYRYLYYNASKLNKRQLKERIALTRRRLRLLEMVQAKPKLIRKNWRRQR